MNEKTYDGWTNYQTWAVARWIDRSRSSRQYWRGMARLHQNEPSASDSEKDGIWNAQQAAMNNLADQIYMELNDSSFLWESNLYSDLACFAMKEVNWSEVAERLFANLAKDDHPVFGPVISAFTRAQALADGVLVDVSEMAREAGLKHPTAMTSAVWAGYVAVPEGVEAQDQHGRLWDILMMLSFTIQRGAKGSELLYEVLVRNDNRGPRPVKLKAICGPGDSAEPVLTIMLPEED
jgi:hypothetical protein